jgi:hypothetical protein
MKDKTIVIGIFILLLGILGRLAENYFYGGRLDENNVVQESFFLPLSFILSGIGFILIIIAILKWLYFNAKK